MGNTPGKIEDKNENTKHQEEKETRTSAQEIEREFEKLAELSNKVEELEKEIYNTHRGLLMSKNLLKQNKISQNNMDNIRSNIRKMENTISKVEEELKNERQW
ncbi:hypothetical protein BB559_006388 [Furculomyces boomerangus]|uniref:Uncharacterized protein n=1 Tax=Furculomyces boomerangus TaxID=61424 RepID=A0A2T9Y398_9FUNG|nr:hypothetical protein BB559_007017 [Furculomyces boomerangus]PVU86829.1 hypothetical protein BB559_006388 [Furculomyces boomerangus]